MIDKTKSGSVFPRSRGKMRGDSSMAPGIGKLKVNLLNKFKRPNIMLSFTV